ncbi:phosphate ABC transporter permease subunit PstC [bacterium]|nr:phosphate ABC transporter permease subunit PstC [bacterium]
MNATLDTRVVKEKLIHFCLGTCGCVSILTTLGIVLILVTEAWGFFQHVSLVEFLTDTEWTPLFADKHFGILPLISGTIITSLIALSVAIPLGLIIAIYLSEFASERVRKTLKPMLEILAGIPTIVFGYFALLSVTPFLQKFIPELTSFNALGAGIVMGFMILPMVASLSEDALFVVPASLREGAYALGASKLQMIFSVLVPAALGGITAAFIIAVSRAVGETMIVAIAAGQEPIFTLNPLRSMETMTAYIVQVSLGDTPHGTLEYQTIFAVGLMLFIITLVLNFISITLRERYKRSFQ